MIREAKQTDTSIILEIMNDAIEHTTSIYDYETRTIDFVENWLTKKKADNMPVLVYEIEGKAVAYGTYGVFRAWDGYKFSIEHAIYVNKHFRRRGLGTQLLIALMEKARTDGYHTMIAGIDASNEKSISFHQKLGFFEAGRFKEVGFKFDKWLDLVFMQLML